MLIPLTMTLIIKFISFSLLILSSYENPLSNSTKPTNLVALVDPEFEKILSKLESSECIGNECNSRLLTEIEVSTYELEYIYNSTDDSTVQGRVVIDFDLKESTDQLIYHVKRFVNLSEPILEENGIYHPVTVRLYPPNDYITLRSTSNASRFQPNHYTLTQTFVVDLTDGNIGFYQGIFKTADGKREKLLASKFQPTDARKAFPCFDEPQLKAIFKITLVHPMNTIALANFPSVEEKVDGHLMRTVFADTFPMSTYLAAWAILPDTYGKLVGQVNGIPINVWARQKPTKQGHTSLALEIAINSVEFFTEYFNTSEPLTPKIDLLAVPDFASGAMENWGLVSFREDRIIFNEKIVSRLQKQQLGETIAHEIAHFWFGNYVTCKWWDDLWLNEAMATWLSYKPFTDKYPDWNMELQVLTEDIIPVMWDDGKPSSHAIVMRNVTGATEITSLFNSITYSKGASILRMLEKIVGSDVFRDRLRDYLRMNAFNVGDPSIFYNNLFTNISGEEFMRNWLEESNYPILHVHLSSNENGTEISFNQSRFIISTALDASKLNPDYRWKINVQCILGIDSDDFNMTDTTVIEFMLETESETRSFPDQKYTWIKCNRHYQGFFITLYSSGTSPKTMWEKFANLLEIEPTLFSVEDKVNILQDSFLLAYKGLINYVEPLRIVRALVKINSEEFVIWRALQWHWDLLSDLVEYLPNTWTLFKNFAIDQILYWNKNVTNIVQTNATDDHNTKSRKGLQFSFLCRMDYEEAIEHAHTLFKSIPSVYFNGSELDTGVGPDFLSTSYICHLSNDDNQEDWNMMYNYYKNAISPQEQTRALVAICSTNNRQRLNRLLNDGLYGGSSSIKRQDFFALMAYMSRHPTGRDVAWTFYKKNFQRLVSIYTLENRRLGTVLNAIARSFENQTYVDDIYTLFERYPNAGAGVFARKQTLDQVNMNIAWVESREENLRQALEMMSQQ